MKRCESVGYTGFVRFLLTSLAFPALADFVEDNLANDFIAHLCFIL